MKLRHLPVILSLLGALVATVHLYAKTKEGERFYKDAQKAEGRKDYDAAADLYTKAYNEDPRDAAYNIGMRRARFLAAEAHVKTGRAFRENGMFAEAMAEFQRAVLLDPSLAVALEEIKRTQEMIADPGRPNQANLTPAQRAKQEAAERVASIQGIPQLDTPVKRVGPLKMNNQPVTILYNTVAGIAGATVVWDSTWQPAQRNQNKYDVDMPEMTAEQAFDYLALVTRTYWKPLTPTTLFVTEDTTNKRRDFEDNVVKTFFVTNATTVQEFQEIVTAIRTITDIRRVFQYNAQKAMVVRGPAEAVALAEKLVRDLDRAKAEVIVDVFVMEASNSRTRELAASIQAANSFGLLIPFQFNPRNAITRTDDDNGSSAAALRLNALGRISSADFSTTLPNALLQALLTDSTTRLIAAPQVRASDGQKGSLRVGDRVPTASGSFQSGIGGGAGGFPSVNTQYQYLEVGVNLDIQPQVHSENELTLHVDVELSTVSGFQDIGGVSLPTVRQDKNSADIRMRSGEVNILSGLNRQQDATVITGIPGLVNIPILGKYLFGKERVERDRSELMIAIVPRIIRTPDYSAESLRGIYAGTDQAVELRFNPRPGEEDAAPPGGAAPGDAPATTPQTGQPQTPAPGGVPGGNLPENQGGGGPGPQARLTFMPGVVTAAANAPFTVNLNLENAANVAGAAPLRISWNPAIMRLNDIAPGELLSRDGGRVTSVKDIRNDQGTATLTITRPAGSAGINGGGTLAVLNFVATASGSGTVTVTELTLNNTQNQAQPVNLGALPVAVQ